MAELWDLVDRELRPVGMQYVRGSSDPIPAGMYHMAVEIWVRSPEGALLVTQRHPDKPFGLMWECTGGAVTAGEDMLRGAVRELREETGIDARPGELIKLDEFIGSNWIMHSFLYPIPEIRLRIAPQEGEVVDWAWLMPDELDACLDLFAPSIRRRYLQYREKLLADHTGEGVR